MEKSANKGQNPRPLKVPDEDIRKCGEEIKQLRNQQFILSTTALGLFGVYASFLLKFFKNDTLKNDPQQTLILTGSAIAILIVFFILFYWTRQLRVLIGIISIWLEIVGKSTWEFDFRAYYNKHRPVSQTELASYSFLILGFGTVGLVLTMLRSFGEMDLTKPELWVLFIASILYLIFVYVLGFRKQGIDEDQVRTRWTALISDACYRRGCDLDMEKKYGEAIIAYEIATELNSNYAGAWHKKALALQHLGYDNDADIAFSKAKELDYTAPKSS